MSAGRPAGTPKTGGRQKGTPNAKTKGILAKLKELDCDPIVGMAMMAKGEIPCINCNDDGKMSLLAVMRAFGIKPEEELIKGFSETLIQCPMCDGSKTERVGQKIRSDMYKELANYVAPKRKSLEVSGHLGGDKTPDVGIVES